MTLAVDRLELGPFGTNMYVVRASADAADAVVVDPSADGAAVETALADAGIRCAAILVTHSHIDHVVGVAALAEATGAPVYAPAGERATLEQPQSFMGLTAPACRPDVWLSGGETVEAAGIPFAVTLVPGHSPGHVAYHTDRHLFSGDVLFAGSVGRTDLPGGDWSVLLASIASLVDAYPRDTVVHSGHGPETTLGAELDRNPFLGELRAARSNG